jgi:Tfp pilus assembly protein PilO
MNANELADELDSMLKKVGLENNRVPTMLRSQSETIASLQESNRQQQAEIEALKEAVLKTIPTLKWSEDLLREANHDEAVSDIQDCIVALRLAIRKAQEK